jgi:hypothetical protein
MGPASSFTRMSREKWLRVFARVGLGAHGIVYCLMSILSVMAAAGLGGHAAGKSDAFRTIYGQPFGRVILFVIGVCMLGYVLLRFFQAFKDTRHEGNNFKALLRRTGAFFIGLVYLGLSYTAINLAIFGAKEHGDKKKLLVDKALDLPGGVVLVGAAGCILVGSGIYQVYRGASRRFMKHVDLRDSDFRTTFKRIGVAGYVARGMVFALLGFFIVKAAIHVNPDEAESTKGAFDFLKNNFGNFLMGLIATGLLAFGVFMLVRARHEKMNFDQS